jgi:hypothetical protein
MSKERANLGFSDALEDVGTTVWPQKPTKRTGLPSIDRQPEKEATALAAERAGFRSREPKAAATAELVTVRRRRTGRNAQFNLKAKPETIKAFCDIADLHGWGLGETLEKAVELLMKEYS